MKPTTIVPVILSGGSGTRLWPLSRQSRPKQMLPLLDDASLIQATIRRTSPAHGFAAPVFVAGADHLDLVWQQLAAIGVDPGAIILEPAGRNTAPAIALAACELDPDALMLVMPSDHIVRNDTAFRAAVAAAAALAADGWLVTFGVTPEYPETGYGYIEAADTLAVGVQRVARFVEKPDRRTAADYVASGRFFWNAGIFLFSAGTYRAALARHAPAIATAVEAAHRGARRGAGTVWPAREAFLAAPSDSIDYAVMEKADRVAVAPVDMGWSDIGAFAALWAQSPKDADGNASAGDVIAMDTRNCLIRSEGPLVAAIGVDGVSIVATGDAVLVVAHDRAQDVKALVDALKAQGRDDIC
jgi:mannose-1-phosphate guanylyltransferase/mannose-1-phosphate guanylyltransferase/mannose-6-phosphate isomerase